MNKDHDLKKNGEGYYDPTPYRAIKHLEEEAKDADKRFYELLHTIFHICNIAGFDVEGRIMLKDKKSGKVWR